MSRLEIFSCALCPLCLFVFACISCFACLLLLTFICSLACTALPCLGLRLPLHPFVCVPAFSYGGWLDLRRLVFIPPPLSPFILSPFSPLLVLCLLLVFLCFTALLGELVASKLLVIFVPRFGYLLVSPVACLFSTCFGCVLVGWDGGSHAFACLFLSSENLSPHLHSV